MRFRNNVARDYMWLYKMSYHLFQYKVDDIFADWSDSASGYRKVGWYIAYTNKVSLWTQNVCLMLIFRL